jgi:starch phosphorylase
MVGKIDTTGHFRVSQKYSFEYAGKDSENHVFELNLKPDTAGLNHYKIRMYPYHELLSHPFELGYMMWV